MKLKKLLFAGLLITAFATTLNAQQYNTAFGVRLGYDSGLSLKHFFAPANAAEFILSASPRYFQLAGLYEYQQPIPGAPNLDWYLGLGAHIGGIHHNKDNYDNAFLIGADIIGGIEYIFHRPLLLLRSTGNHRSTSQMITTIIGTADLRSVCATPSGN